LVVFFSFIPVGLDYLERSMGLYHKRLAIVLALIGRYMPFVVS
jgi:hypothetical protein